MLKLRNLNSEFDFYNSKQTKYYYDNTKNNWLIVNMLDSSVNEDDIYNGIRNETYNYVINKMNTESNMLVVWSAIDGTTSDYTIYLNCDFDEEMCVEEIEDDLRNKYELICGYKYQEVNCKAGTVTKLFDKSSK